MAHSPLRRAALEQEGPKWARVVSWRSTCWGCLGTPITAPYLSWSTASLNAEPTHTLDLFWADSTLPPQAPLTAHSLWQSSLSSRCGAVQELESWHSCSVQARACGGVVVGNQLESWVVSTCPLHLVLRSKQPCACYLGIESRFLQPSS